MSNISNTRPRGNQLEIQLKHIYCKTRKFFLVITVWNSLPDGFVSADSSYTFKNRLNEFGLIRLYICADIP